MHRTQGEHSLLGLDKVVIVPSPETSTLQFIPTLSPLLLVIHATDVSWVHRVLGASLRLILQQKDKSERNP